MSEHGEDRVRFPAGVKARKVPRGVVAARPLSPCPKPPKKPKARRKPLARKSATKRQPVAYEAAAISKGERIRDPEHLDRIRAMPCACASEDCGPRRWSSVGLSERIWISIEAAHVTNKGWGGGDNEVVPLCPNHHRLLACSWHVAGRKRFERMFGKMAPVALALYDETLALRGKATP